MQNTKMLSGAAGSKPTDDQSQCREISHVQEERNSNATGVSATLTDTAQAPTNRTSNKAAMAMCLRLHQGWSGRPRTKSTEDVTCPMCGVHTRRPHAKTLAQKIDPEPQERTVHEQKRFLSHSTKTLRKQTNTTSAENLSIRHENPGARLFHPRQPSSETAAKKF